jgi:hypothetical protein
VTLENETEEEVKIPASFYERDVERFLHMKYGSQKWLAYSKTKLSKDGDEKQTFMGLN